jgi:hypothetical protein
MGCHGSQGQNRAGAAGDFSVILAVGHVAWTSPPGGSVAQAVKDGSNLSVEGFLASHCLVIRP